MKSDAVKMIVKTAFSLFLICAVASGILGVVNMISEPIIAENNEKAENAARAQVLKADHFTKCEKDGNEYYKGLDGSENTVGFVFITSGAGYGGAGSVQLMTGVDAQGRVSGLKILALNETPGLGMNAKKPDFINQFLDKSGELTVVKNKEPDSGEILAMTSATVTSKAVTSAVNDALKLYEQVKEG